MPRLFHITTEVELTEARSRGEYRPRAFERERFVHCSYLSQVAATATRIFRGRADLVLLEIDSVQLHCEVVDENLEGGTETFPHVYGPIPLTAITRIHPFPCADDGTFALPRTLAG